MFVITNNDVIPLQFLKWYLQPTTIRRKTFVEQIIELYPFLCIVNKSLFEKLFYWSMTSIHHFFSSLWTCQAMIFLCCSVLWLKWRNTNKVFNQNKMTNFSSQSSSDDVCLVVDCLNWAKYVECERLVICPLTISSIVFIEKSIGKLSPLKDHHNKFSTEQTIIESEKWMIEYLTREKIFFNQWNFCLLTKNFLKTNWERIFNFHLSTNRHSISHFHWS